MSDSDGIRAVIWDFGGVLMRTHDYTPRNELGKRFGISGEELERRVFENEMNYKATIGEVTAEDFWNNVVDSFQAARAERRAFEAAFWSGDRLDTELLDFIRSLRPRYKTALLSNAWDDLRRYITEELKMIDAFDEVIISAEVGLHKPDPRIYQLALERLGVSPHQAVFVDDIALNVEGARAVGLHAIQFRDPVQVKIELLELLNLET